MYSNDGSLRLTTHRIIYEIKGKKEQIMLEDFERFEYTNAHINTFKGLAIVCNAITILLVLVILSTSSPVDGFLAGLLINAWALMPFLILSFTTILLYKLSRRHYVLLIGKYNFIEVRLENPQHYSVKKFLDKVITQSAVRKKELSGIRTS